MFDLFGDDGHDDRVEAQADLFNTLGYSDVRADHTSDYPDPEQRNGRVPDVTADSPFGRDPVVEIDSGTTTSKRDQRQLDDLESGIGPDERLVQIDDDDQLFGGW
ncbi:hypothetical protein NDI85_20770 [Halomicroarcula sp. S1AR25-4]|jgi:hypothetical protein|uniref:hypothetical protein n=1 Tax=Halobacteriales TaxID=2235 RepID=UPI0010923039|nr:MULTISPECIES: hypothetical protein [Halobacteria]MDS0280222.1 hypothetical protein [Halomicroarcula sp. S1AR25-4]